MSEIDKILEERAKVHGDFERFARLCQDLKHIAQQFQINNEVYMSSVQNEALNMILHKIARVLNGDPNHVDHWDDIAGYATLVSRNLTKESNE